MVVGVLVKHTDKRLLELRGCEAIRKKHVTTGIVGQVLHFQKTNLIETPSEDIDNVTIVRGALGEVFVELNGLARAQRPIDQQSYFNSLLEILDIVPVNIMMRADRFLQLGGNNIARTFGGCTTGEGHDTGTGVLEGGFQQANCNAQSNTSATKGSLVVCHGPGITLHLLEDVGDLELGLLHRQEEPRSWTKRRTGGLLLRETRANAGSKAEHLLDLLGGVVFVALEHIGLGAFGVAELMNLGLKGKKKCQ